MSGLTEQVTDPVANIAPEEVNAVPSDAVSNIPCDVGSPINHWKSCEVIRECVESAECFRHLRKDDNTCGRRHSSFSGSQSTRLRLVGRHNVGTSMQVVDVTRIRISRPTSPQRTPPQIFSPASTPPMSPPPTSTRPTSPPQELTAAPNKVDENRRLSRNSRKSIKSKITRKPSKKNKLTKKSGNKGMSTPVKKGMPKSVKKAKSKSKKPKSKSKKPKTRGEKKSKKRVPSNNQKSQKKPEQKNNKKKPVSKKQIAELRQKTIAQAAKPAQEPGNTNNNSKNVYIGDDVSTSCQNFQSIKCTPHNRYPRRLSQRCKNKIMKLDRKFNNSCEKSSSSKKQRSQDIEDSDGKSRKSKKNNTKKRKILSEKKLNSKRKLSHDVSKMKSPNHQNKKFSSRSTSIEKKSKTTRKISNNNKGNSKRKLSSNVDSKIKNKSPIRQSKKSSMRRSKNFVKKINKRQISSEYNRKFKKSKMASNNVLKNNKSRSKSNEVKKVDKILESEKKTSSKKKSTPKVRSIRNGTVKTRSSPKEKSASKVRSIRKGTPKTRSSPKEKSASKRISTPKNRMTSKNQKNEMTICVKEKRKASTKTRQVVRTPKARTKVVAKSTIRHKSPVHHRQTTKSVVTNKRVGIKRRFVESSSCDEEDKETPKIRYRRKMPLKRRRGNPTAIDLGATLVKDDCETGGGGCLEVVSNWFDFFFSPMPGDPLSRRTNSLPKQNLKKVVGTKRSRTTMKQPNRRRRNSAAIATHHVSKPIARSSSNTDSVLDCLRQDEINFNDDYYYY